MGLGLSCLLLLRASELCAKDGRRGHGVNCMRTGDIAFSRGDHQVFRSKVEEANKVEMVFWGSKGDQGRKGAILVRTVDSGRREREAVKLLAELTREEGDRGVPPSLPLMSYRSRESGE